MFYTTNFNINYKNLYAKIGSIYRTLLYLSKPDIYLFSMDNLKHKICAITGHRPKGFPWNYQDKNCGQHKEYLKSLEGVLSELIAEGFNYFISGGAIGADQDFAEIVLKIKKHYPHIRLEIAVPCPNQDIKWCESDKKRYRRILKKADFINILSTAYTSRCMQERNEYMADKCDLLLVVWNGQKSGGTYNTFIYAKGKNKPCRLVKITVGKPC